MTTIVSKPDEKLLTPAGTHQAVCSGVWDLGIQKISYKGIDKLRHQIYFRWELNEIIKEEGKYEGKRYVCGKKYTAILASKAHLYKDLVSWRGKPFSAEELEGFDLDKVLGANCLISIIHNETPDRTFANVDAVMPLAKGMIKMVPELTNDPPEWVTKAIAVQYKGSEESQGQSGYNAEEAYDAAQGGAQKPVCKECGGALKTAAELKNGLCDSCDLPF